MKKQLYLFLLFFLSIFIWTGCNNVQKETKDDSTEIQQKVDEFAEYFVKMGFTVIVRWSKGRDIRSACGQLAGE